MALKLIVETPAPEECKYVFEEQNNASGSTLYIQGPYMMAAEKNRNGRVYDLTEMETEVNRYMSEMVHSKRAMGELNHPTTAEVDLERACHLVTEMSQDGNIFHGKSKVLSTPCGLVVKSLVNDGVQVGMSSRALGRIEERDNCNIVHEMKLVAIDCVADPSCPTAFVNGILESKEWVVSVEGKLEEAYNDLERGIRDLPKKELNDYLLSQVTKFLRKL